MLNIKCIHKHKKLNVLFKNYKLNKNNNYLLPSIKKLKEGNK
jgi:hypothetical protein